jgi:AcrR family transcriptional regulator
LVGKGVQHLTPQCAANVEEEGEFKMARGRARARSPEDQERVRKKFVDCARSVFTSVGAHGLTMRRLAAEAGYSAGTIYLYFPSRHDLLRELWKEDMEGLLCYLNAAVAEVSDPCKRLRLVLEGYAAFWMERPDHFRGMFLENDRDYLDERAAFVNDDSVVGIHTYLLKVTSEALAERGRSGADVQLLTHSLLASVHGVIALHIGTTAFPWSPATDMVAVVLDGVLGGLNLS